LGYILVDFLSETHLVTLLEKKQKETRMERNKKGKQRDLSAKKFPDREEM
jgi:hypothetical protein